MENLNEQKTLVQEYLTSDQLGEYNYILKDINHFEEQALKFRELLSKAISQKQRFDRLAEIQRDISLHDNQNYNREED